MGVSYNRLWKMLIDKNMKRCCSRFQEISNREIQRNQRFRTRGRSPCGTDAYP